jgi:phosphate transport system permease protein
VEIPEAPLDGSLYRILFLSAVILFVLTFVLNTVAEIVRQRLRKKYGRF